MFALFIWVSESETIKCDNWFRSVYPSGVGLTHLFFRQMVKGFCFLRDIQHAILRELVQTKLLSHLPFYVVTTQVCECQSLHVFWMGAADSFSFLKVCFSEGNLFSVPKKKAYMEPGCEFIPVSFYWYLHCYWPGQDVLCRVAEVWVSARVKSFSEELRSWMKRRVIFSP